MKDKTDTYLAKFKIGGMFEQIDRHKTIILIFIVLMTIVSTLLWGGYMKDDKTSYLTMMGSCKQQTSITIIDESIKGKIPRWVFATRKKLFKEYVDTISKQIFSKVNEMGQCQGQWGDPEVQLVFVYRPVVGSAKKSLFGSTVDFNLIKSQDTKSLDTPWVKMTIDKSPKLIVRAVFLWNERQFLLDQAVMSGLRPTSREPLLPLDEKIFWAFIPDYSNTVIIAPREELDKDILKGLSQNNIFKRDKENKLKRDSEAVHNALKQYPDTVSAAKRNISNRMPVDILWMFDYQVRKNFPPFGGLGLELDETFNKRATQYSNLTQALLNNRFTSPQTKQSYSSILDVKNIFNIDKYRIN
jgi:hypothetical protein